MLVESKGSLSHICIHKRGLKWCLFFRDLEDWWRYLQVLCFWISQRAYTQATYNRLTALFAEWVSHRVIQNHSLSASHSGEILWCYFPLSISGVWCLFLVRHSLNTLHIIHLKKYHEMLKGHHWCPQPEIKELGYEAVKSPSQAYSENKCWLWSASGQVASA